MTEVQKPTHFLVLFSFGDSHWTQLTVLSFLSMQCRLNDDIPKFRTVVVTDNKRSIKAYFGNWVEIIQIEKERLKAIVDKPNGVMLFRLGLLHDIIKSRRAKVLSIESDLYHKASNLPAFNSLDKGRIVVGKKSHEMMHEAAVLGFGFENLDQLNALMSRVEAGDEADGKHLDLSSFPADSFDVFDDYFHYKGEMEERLPQIERFFNRHYYREMGELYSMVNLWTPEKWHLSDKEMPEELL